ncbi:hypothetical protein QBD01_003721 [Ochrobactrum sp. 19YEA23]|uniref:hypothetical protein n=1 Tax=Ochrobactrum sp. 19YEA23 TaxID=3039854 RepID=UPI002478B475|nr:hypothetical protein [Ochrobactrum sp. 19YEA23]
MSEQAKQQFFSLSQVQRQLAKEYRDWAIYAEIKGKGLRAAEYWQKSERLWNSAFRNLNLAR